MSTTSNPFPVNELTLDQGGSAPKNGDLSGAMAALPDPAVIARLANEFFAALPGQPGSSGVGLPSGAPGSPVEVSSIATAPPNPSAPPSAPIAAPYFTERENAVSPASEASYPSLVGLFSFPALTETDLGAIPASLTDATPRRPDAFASAAPPAIPGSTAYFLDADSASGKTASPLATSASLPSLDQAFSFPGVPGAQSVPGTGVPTVPSSPPSTPPTGPELRESGPATPGTSGYARDGGVTATAAESGPERFEFNPQLVPQIGLAKRQFDPHVIKRDFPILQERINGHPLIWLDNAATTQKPNAVIDRISSFYRHENSNVHRAAHTLAARSTDAYEGARDKVRRFLNASSAREIVFVRGATEGINLVAKSWGQRNVQKGDEIVITWLEHHANIVPWQQLAAEKGARLRVAPVDDSGQVILDEYEKLLGPRARIVAFSQVSNALGTITPAKAMIEMAHRHGARVLVDAAQSVAHLATDVQSLDCDFLVFSGHKIFAPTGVGVVFGKSELLENTPPWQGGGNMILDVTFEKTVYNTAPARFEAGTGTIADAVGLGAALDYLDEIGLENIARYEHELLEYGTARLLTVPGLRLIGTAREKAGVLSFVLDGVPNDEVGKALNQEGIAVRTGHHCAQPILRRFGVESTVRPSLALYNTREDIDVLVAAVLRIQAGQGRTAR